jgi:hypothetical protein
MSQPPITIYVRYEPTWQSICNDVMGMAIIGGLVALNEVTIKSGALNFLFGFVGILWFISVMYSKAMNQRVSGDDEEQVIAAVRERMRLLRRSTVVQNDGKDAS